MCIPKYGPKFIKEKNCGVKSMFQSCGSDFSFPIQNALEHTTLEYTSKWPLRAHLDMYVFQSMFQGILYDSGIHSGTYSGIQNRNSKTHLAEGDTLNTA